MIIEQEIKELQAEQAKLYAKLKQCTADQRLDLVAQTHKQLSRISRDMKQLRELWRTETTLLSE